MVFVGIGLAILVLALGLYWVVKAYPYMEETSYRIAGGKKRRTRTPHSEANGKDTNR